MTIISRLLLADLEEMLARVRQIRANLYPPGWEYDPWLEVERELARIVEQHRQG